MDIKVTLSRVIIGHKNKKGSIKPPYIKKLVFYLVPEIKPELAFMDLTFLYKVHF
jgi:hypothetical protein